MLYILLLIILWNRNIIVLLLLIISLIIDLSMKIYELGLDYICIIIIQIEIGSIIIVLIIIYMVNGINYDLIKKMRIKKMRYVVSMILINNEIVSKVLTISKNININISPSTWELIYGYIIILEPYMYMIGVLLIITIKILIYKLR